MSLCHTSTLLLCIWAKELVHSVDVRHAFQQRPGRATGVGSLFEIIIGMKAMGWNGIPRETSHQPLLLEQFKFLCIVCIRTFEVADQVFVFLYILFL
jgi:hypothetical protein